MHSLLPDSVRVYRPGLAAPVADIPLMRTRHAASPALISEHGIENIALSMGVQLAGALVNNNYPAAMLDMPIPGEPVVDLGAIDLFRDRERGVPPYNTLRAELGLNRIRSFDDLTEDAALAAKLRSLYGQHVDGSDRVEDMDLLVGTLCEGHRPARASASARRCSRSSSSTRRGGCSAIASTPTTTARASTPARASTGSTTRR